MAHRTPLERHAAYFADENNQLTYDHMVKVQANIGSEGYLKSKGAADAIMEMLQGKDATPEEIAAVPNSAATGLWRKDGQLNEYLFKALETYSVEARGVACITKAAFKTFLKDQHSCDSDRATGINTTRDFSSIRFIQSSCLFAPGTRFGISRQQVTDASIDRLFDDFYNRDLRKSPGLQNALTMRELRLFYEDSPAFFKRFEKRPHAEMRSRKRQRN
jgi:hypothetical protein